MIQSLAGELELDIYIISLSRAGLDDNELNELISRLPGLLMNHVFGIKHSHTD